MNDQSRMPGQDSAPGQVIKVFGERNTGTRAVNLLLRQVPGLAFRIVPRHQIPPVDGDVQAAIESQLRGHWKRLYLHAMRDDIAARHSCDDPWKHALPRLSPAMVRARVATILMVRNPYSWLLGLARRPYHIKGPNVDTLEAFAARPWMTERREGMAAVLASPLDLWSLKAGGSLTYQAEAYAQGLPTSIIRFEDFVAAPEATLRGGLSDMGLGAPGLARLLDNTKPLEAPLSQLQAYYQTEAWRARLTRETVSRVNARVDWAAARALGYQKLDPTDFPDALPPAEARAMHAEMASLCAPSHTAACAKEPARGQAPSAHLQPAAAVVAPAAMAAAGQAKMLHREAGAAPTA